LIGDAQLKPYLFDQLALPEEHRGTFEVETSFISVFNEKWVAQIGAQYAMSRYKTTEYFEIMLSNPDEAIAYSNEFNFVTANTFGGLTSSLTVNVDESDCYQPFGSTIQNEFDVTLGTWNAVDLLGIPLKFGRIFGKKNLKLYTTINLTPKFIFNKNIDVEKHRFTGINVWAGSNNHFCLNEMSERVDVFDISSNVDQTEWHLRDSRLDAGIEIGILHKIKSSWLRIGIHYGESITPYSDFDENNKQVQQMGLRVGYAIETFKS